MKLITIAGAMLVVLTACSMPDGGKAAEQEIVKFHKMLDAEKFDEIYEQSGQHQTVGTLVRALPIKL